MSNFPERKMGASANATHSEKVIPYLVDQASSQTLERIATSVEQPLSARGSQIHKPRQSSATLLLLGGLIIFFLWAALFEIDQTVRAQGQIIPSARTQIIQAADGGVLAELLVREGEKVEAGQRVAVLEKERVGAVYEESRSKVAALSAALVRAKAESSGIAPVFGASFDDYPEFVAVQKRLYLQRQRGLRDQLQTLQGNLDIALEELRINQSLFDTGDISRVEVMRVKQQVGELEGERKSIRNQYLQDAQVEASKLEVELSSAKHKLEEHADVLAHAEIKAPAAGVVKYLKFNTVGGVLRRGDELMQISPTTGDIVVEVKVRPADIGQLSIGLPATVKLDAFDYSIYGALSGTLTYISVDTLNEQGANGQTMTYYRAQIQLDGRGDNNKKLSAELLKHGMTAMIDIQTNRRTVLQYLAKPVFRAFGGALSER